jgi:hypothetical protein
MAKDLSIEKIVKRIKNANLVLKEAKIITSENKFRKQFHKSNVINLDYKDLDQTQEILQTDASSTDFR